jgi:ADP-L-glycero-D-manno-heptose 6-epimerase
MSKNILITGGAGFIGARLALYLQEKFLNSDITVFDTFYDGVKLPNGNLKYLGTFKNLKKFKGRVVCGDICNPFDLKQIEGIKFDIIFHLAAISDTRVEEQSQIFRNNINSFNYFIELAKKLNAKLVYASSAAVYGNSKQKSLKLGDENPESAYAFSKFAMDNIAKSIIKSNIDIQIIGLRYFNVYGFGEQHKGKTSSTILQFANQIMDGISPTLFKGSEKIFRDFVYIDDIIQGTVKAAFSDANGIFNLGSGVSRSFMEVLNLIQKKLGTDMPVNLIDNPYNSGYQFYTEADITETIDQLNYIPEFSLEDGISNYLDILIKKYDYT